MARVIKTLEYSIADVVPYINWLYFFHAWGLSGKPDSEKNALREEAMQMLASMESRYATHAVFGLFDANADGDDIIIDGLRFPMLRQQTPTENGNPTLCLADFIRPLSHGVTDTIGAFAATVDKSMETDYKNDDYKRMLAQTLADRLAEATVERLHQQVRTQWWGYAPDEHLTVEQMLREDFQGIRPAVGYPSIRHKHELPTRPLARHEDHWHKAHGLGHDDAACFGLRTDVRSSCCPLFQSGKNR